MSAVFVPAAAEHPGQQLYQLINMLEAPAALETATRLGILDHLQETPASTDEIALHRGTAPGPTHLLLDELDALGVLRLGQDGRYATTAATRWFTTLAAGWSHLDHVVRTGQPLVPADTPAGAAELHPEAVTALSRLGDPAAELLAPVRGDVLDVGAGAAPWSIALALADPTARVTALDLPEVLCTTRATVEAERLPPVQPGPEPGSAASLGLRMRTSAGAVHSLQAYTTWTRDAGYGEIRATSLSRKPPLALITCTAPNIDAATITARTAARPGSSPMMTGSSSRWTRSCIPVIWRYGRRSPGWASRRGAQAL